MRNIMMAALVAVSVSAPAMIVTSTEAAAQQGWREREARKYERRYERRYAKPRRYRDNPYAARAHDLDPAGDYKAYPDWARVALSPKLDGNRR